MLIWGALFALGLLGLYLGAEALVRGAPRLARSFGVCPLFIGLTVVAFGTSAPELVVSVLAAGSGRVEVALGNVVGSNIANIALILGLAAALSPLAVQSRVVRREIPVMIVVSLGLVPLVADGRLGRLEASGCLLGFAGYLLFLQRSGDAAGGAVAPASARSVEQAPGREEAERTGSVRPGAPGDADRRVGAGGGLWKTSESVVSGIVSWTSAGPAGIRL